MRSLPSLSVTEEAGACSVPLSSVAFRFDGCPAIWRRTGTCWPRTVAVPSQVPTMGAEPAPKAKAEVASRKDPANSFPGKTFMARLDSFSCKSGGGAGRGALVQSATRLCAGQHEAAATTEDVRHV